MKFQIEPYLTSMKDGESKVSVFANDINRKWEALRRRQVSPWWWGDNQLSIWCRCPTDDNQLSIGRSSDSNDTRSQSSAHLLIDEQISQAGSSTIVLLLCCWLLASVTSLSLSDRWPLPGQWQLIGNETRQEIIRQTQTDTQTHRNCNSFWDIWKTTQTDWCWIV